MGSNPTYSASFSKMLVPRPDEIERRRAIIDRILDFTARDERIKLPDFDPATARPSDRFALVNVGLEPNAFGGVLGVYRYQFEGEEDLLHLIVTRSDGESLTAEEGQSVAGFVLQGVPTALIWLRPGQLSQHFYLGHDDLAANIRLDD